MIAKIFFSALIVATISAGAMLQTVADAAQDCKRDSIAFKDACEFSAEHPIMTAFVNR